MRKKTGEIELCVNYWILNSIVVIPLPCIDEALQAVHTCQWLTSFDLVQGLSDSGCSFFCLKEMCLGDQQFVTLLLYLDDICVFATSIDEMLDHI